MTQQRNSDNVASPPPVIGLVGGIASGKSQIARLLADEGASVIDADQIGHDVLTRPLVACQLARLFGDQILDAQGKIDRRALGSLVFESEGAPQRLQQLQEVVHPLIHAEAVKQLRQLRERERPPQLIVIDAPLLLEAGWAPMCDFIWFIETPIEVRIARSQSRGWSDVHLFTRESQQMPLDAKRAMATHIIDGTASAEQQVRHLRHLIRQMQSRR